MEPVLLDATSRLIGTAGHAGPAAVRRPDEIQRHAVGGTSPRLLVASSKRSEGPNPGVATQPAVASRRVMHSVRNVVDISRVPGGIVPTLFRHDRKGFGTERPP